MTANGRTDDGSGESIVRPKFLERANFNAIVENKRMDKLTLQLGLSNTAEAHSFTVCRTWTPPRTVLQLDDSVARVNKMIFVADDELANEELLLGLPVLKRLGTATKSLLKQKRDLPGGNDCSSVRGTSSAAYGRSISYLITARMNKVGNEDTDSQEHDADDNNAPHRSKLEYCSVRSETVSFQDSSLFDPADCNRHGDIIKAVEKMVDGANDNGFPTDKLPKPRSAMTKNANLSCKSCSSCPSASFPPL